MSIKKPVPTRTGRERRLCPYCKQPSYSTSGVHPQCVQRDNDQLAKQQAALRVAALASPPNRFDQMVSVLEQSAR